MRVLAYTLTPRARLSPGSSGQVGTRRDTHTVIPGATVRGALAAAWWAGPGAPAGGTQAAFDRVFDEQMRVGSARPDAARLLPMALARCKYPRCGCQSRGWSVRMAVQDRVCTVCHSGFGEGRGWAVDPGLTVGVTRTALEGGRAATSQLFTRQAIRRVGTFGGTIQLRGQGVDETADWLTTLDGVRIGGQLSTMGHCSFSVVPQPPQATPGPGVFLAALASPAVVLDGFGGPTLDLAGTLQRVLGESGTVAATWSRPTRVSGWHGRAGMTKPEDWALAAGSCAVLTVADPRAHALLERGIGVRRAEGYGELQVKPPAAWTPTEDR